MAEGYDDGIPPGGCIYGLHDYEIYRIVGAIVLLIAALVVKCAYGPIGNDDRMLDAARQIHMTIIEYQLLNKHWPETLDQINMDASSTLDWPVNPYNHTPIADTGSPDFDKKTSVGMVHYELVRVDGKVAGFTLYVFGNKGLLTTIREP